VLFHGYLSSKEAFAAQIEYFSRFFRVTAFDFLGFGGSRYLTNAFSVDDYAEWTEEVLRLLNIEKPHVIAHSFGCRVAVKMAAREGAAFDKIILTGPAGVILPRTFSYHLKVKTYRFIKKIAPRFAEKHFGSKEYRTLSLMMKESYKKIVNEDLRESAKKIDNEVLIVEGKNDQVTTAAEAGEYLRCLKKGRLRMMEGGHFAFAENPMTFNLIAEEFLYD
jgi:pimeloyl-ACP methyl ester carboxylesterase